MTKKKQKKTRVRLNTLPEVPQSYMPAHWRERESKPVSLVKSGRVKIAI